MAGRREWRHVTSRRKRPSREFDGNYIMSISKAAPNLEELELMGTSDDTLVTLPCSLLSFRDVIRSKCRIPSPSPYPGSQSYNVSPRLVSISAANPSLLSPFFFCFFFWNQNLLSFMVYHMVDIIVTCI